jgi:hypothetical protein
VVTHKQDHKWQLGTKRERQQLWRQDWGNKLAMSNGQRLMSRTLTLQGITGRDTTFSHDTIWG